jgi:acyl-[acyl carrier protein]--UDP-N-acetylglucosamine O-acyltransferase
MGASVVVVGASVVVAASVVVGAAVVVGDSVVLGTSAVVGATVVVVVRGWEWSSAKVTSRTQCRPFSNRCAECAYG